MATQLINLGPTPFSLTEQWTGALAIDSALIEGGGAAYLRVLGLGAFQNTIVLRLAANATDDPTDAGPAFISSLEVHASALTLVEAGGESYVLPGPTNSNNLFSDTTDPYEWNPGDPINDLPVWIRNLGSGDVILILSHSDGAAPTVLTEFDTTTTDLITDALALIDAGEPSQAFARAPRTPSGILVDGELDIGLTSEPITRLRILESGSRFTVNNSGVFDLGAYFSVGGAGNDLTVYIQTDGVGERVASWLVSDDIIATTNNSISWDVSVENQVLLQTIEAGDRFIFALAREFTPHFITPTPIEWTFDFPEPQVEIARNHQVEPDSIEWTFDFPEPQVEITKNHQVEPDPVEWTFVLPQPQVQHGFTRLVTPTPIDWVFDFPEPDNVRRGITRLVNPSPILWTFDFPQPPQVEHGTHFVVSPSPLAWLFAFEQPAVLFGEFVPPGRGEFRRELATYQTNRIDLFCRQWLGSDSDETRRQFIRWNYDAFRESPTFWLKVGQRYWFK